MEITISGRLQKIIYEFHQNDRKIFCYRTGISMGTLKPILYGHRTPGFEFCIDLLSYHPNLSLTWLFTGHGEMIVPNVQKLCEEIEQLKVLNEFLKKNR